MMTLKSVMGLICLTDMVIVIDSSQTVIYCGLAKNVNEKFPSYQRKKDYYVARVASGENHTVVIYMR